MTLPRRHPYPCPSCGSVATHKVEGKWTCKRCAYNGKGWVPMYHQWHNPVQGGIRTALVGGVGTYRRPNRI
jgi:ribosomal protein L37AE/L43A